MISPLLTQNEEKEKKCAYKDELINSNTYPTTFDVHQENKIQPLVQIKENAT